MRLKPCEKCGVQFHSYIDSINHRCFTVREWKRFSTNPVKAETNEFQFFNFFTQRMESYDYLTTAEILLSKHTIYIRDHVNRPRVGNMVEVPLKERLKGGLKSLPSKITAKNFDKGMKTFDQGMADFSKAMDQLGDGLGGKKSNKDNLEKLWGNKKTKDMSFITGSKDQTKNLEKIFGTKKKSKSNGIKIWSDKPTKRRKSKSDKWDQDEANLTKLWGKRK